MAEIEADSAVRSIYQGNVVALVGALKPFATEQCWLRPPHAIESRPAKQRRLVKLADVLQAMLKLQDNLSFSHAKVRSAIAKILAEVTWDYGKDLKVAAHTSAKVLRANLRAVQQARIKKPQPAWVKAAMGIGDMDRFVKSRSLAASVEVEEDDDDAEVAEEGSPPSPAFCKRGPDADCAETHVDDDEEELEKKDEAPFVADAQPVEAAPVLAMPPPSKKWKALPVPPAVDPGYVSGWDSEKNMAWRCLLTKGKPGKREWTSTWIPPEDEASAMKSVWPDGYSVTHDDLPHRVWLQRQSKDDDPKAAVAKAVVRKRPASTQEVFKMSRMTPDGHKVTLRKKVCRVNLWQIMVDGAAKLQMPLDQSSSLPLMQQILVALEKGEVQPTGEALKLYRSELTKAAGGEVSGGEAQAAVADAAIVEYEPASVPSSSSGFDGPPLMPDFW